METNYIHRLGWLWSFNEVGRAQCLLSTGTREELKECKSFFKLWARKLGPPGKLSPRHWVSLWRVQTRLAPRGNEDICPQSDSRPASVDEALASRVPQGRLTQKGERKSLTPIAPKLMRTPVSPSASPWLYSAAGAVRSATRPGLPCGPSADVTWPRGQEIRTPILFCP